MPFLFAEETGPGTSIIKTLPADMPMQAVIDIMVAEAIKTLEIKGEYLNRRGVMSFIRSHQGLNAIPEHAKKKLHPPYVVKPAVTFMHNGSFLRSAQYQNRPF